jgi:hypothetical protein
MLLGSDAPFSATSLHVERECSQPQSLLLRHATASHRFTAVTAQVLRLSNNAWRDVAGDHVVARGVAPAWQWRDLHATSIHSRMVYSEAKAAEA